MYPPRPQRRDRRFRTTTTMATKQDTDQAQAHTQATNEQPPYEESLEIRDDLKPQARQKVRSADQRQRVLVGQPEDDGGDGDNDDDDDDGDEEESDDNGGNNSNIVSDDSLTAITATGGGIHKAKKVMTKASSINISDYDDNSSGDRYSTSEISAANSSQFLQSSPLPSTSTSHPASPASLPAKPTSRSLLSGISPNQRLSISGNAHHHRFHHPHHHQQPLVLTRSGSELLIGSNSGRGTARQAYSNSREERSANNKKRHYRDKSSGKQRDHNYFHNQNYHFYSRNRNRKGGNLLQRSLSSSSIFTFYLSKYAREKFHLALRTFKTWYHEQLTYHHLSRRMEFNQQLFEQWFKSKGRPLSLRAMDRYDQIVIWIAGKF